MQAYMQGKAEVIEFNGVKFRRYPESKRWADRVYYRPHSGHIRAGMEALHREIWKQANGAVPDGYHIHHIDGNPLNNELSNLGCVPVAEHLHHHGDLPKSPEYIAIRRRSLDKARDGARIWHGSEEGRKWHSEHGKESWEDHPMHKCTCAFCGKEFETPFPSRAKYCNFNCRSKHYYAQKRNFEERICEECGKPFTVNKWEKRIFCSRACSANGRFNRRRRLQSSG